MGYASVIVSFIVCLFFNVFLNSFDVYSDITLTFHTLTFNLGASLLLSGCRVCHGKEDKDVFKSHRLYFLLLRVPKQPDF